jgi:hypothetical protein
LVQKPKVLSPKDFARKIAFDQYKWGTVEQKCLGSLWGKESAWDYTAKSPTHDYGIPQRHMRANTERQINNFMKNYETQINWGLNYIKVRYDSPCNAWKFWQVKRWY